MMYGTRQTQPLYVREDFPVRVGNAGTGKTVTAKICEERSGDPAAIGTLSITVPATATPTDYEGTFTRSALLSQITGAGLMGRVLFVHLDDGVGWHDVWPVRAVDVDPDIEWRP